MEENRLYALHLDVFESVKEPTCCPKSTVLNTLENVTVHSGGAEVAFYSVPDGQNTTFQKTQHFTEHRKT